MWIFIPLSGLLSRGMLPSGEKSRWSICFRDERPAVDRCHRCHGPRRFPGGVVPKNFSEMRAVAEADAMDQ